MTNFIVVEKDSLNKVSINTQHITLTEASIVHTKMHRNDVAEFLRDGNNLILKLNNGETVLIENFFVVYDKVDSDLVFEEDGCILYWFDGVSGFKGIPGLEVLLPASAAGGSLLPWIIGGGAVIGGIIAAAGSGGGGDKNAWPIAVKDEITGVEDTPVNGNVLTNDRDPDGNAITVTQFVVEGKSYNAGQTVTIDKIGELTLNADGTYHFVPATNWNGTVPTVTYTISDGQGGTASAELVITITPDANPSISIKDENGGSENPNNTTDTLIEQGHVTVYEQGLTDTSGSNKETGSITIGAGDGVKSVTVGDTNILLTDLENASTTPIIINTPHGKIIITDYTPNGQEFNGVSTGGTITYEYELDQPVTNDASHTDNFLEEVGISVTDQSNIVSSGSLVISIIDDAPLAKNDIDNVAANQFTPETGNVLTGVGTSSGATGADKISADGVSISTVVSDNVSANVVTDDGTTLTIEGQYGTLILNKTTGEYSYERHEGTPGGVNEVFTYTLVDGDGDSSTASLTLVIGNSAPLVTLPSSDGESTKVYESGLNNGGSKASTDKETTSGTIAFTSPDGLASQDAVKLGGHTLTTADQTFSDGLTARYEYNSATGTGTIHYSYTLPANTSGDNTNATFAVEVTDIDGDKTASGDLVINIIDDAPVAKPDTNSITEDSVPNPVSGNVLTGGVSSGDTADTQGADKANVSGVQAGTVASGEHVANGALNTAVNGEYGTLILRADGSYTYQLNNNNTDVNALKDNQSLQDVFSYTITDGDGDKSTATITITINGHTDGAPNVVITDHNGSALGANSIAENATTPVQGEFTVNAADGLKSITIGGTTILTSELLGLSPTTPQTIIGTQGTLTLTDYDPVTGKVSYSYQQSGSSKDHSGGDTSVSDTFPIVVTDNANESSAATNLVILITDTAPEAKADTGTVTEDGAALEGNVITGGSSNSTDVADRLGADATQVTGVSKGSSTTEQTGNVGGTGLAGDYGTLILNSDGSYSYTVDPNNATVNALKDGGKLTETFSYTIKDADGDWSTTTLTITINGHTDGVPSITPNDENGNNVGGQITVYESGLSTGSNASAASESASGTIQINAGDGLSSINIGGQTFSLSQLQSLSSSNPSAAINVAGGTIVLNGFTANSSVGGIPTSGSLSYTYTLNNAQTHSAVGNDDLLLSGIPLSVTDAGGVTTTGSLVVQVIDDVPTAVADTGSLSEGGVLSVLAADGVLKNDTAGADGWVNTGAVVGVVSGDTATNSAGGVGGRIDGQYGYITLNADGSYTYVSTADAVTADAQDVFTYTVRDADGDLTHSTLTINVANVNLTPAPISKTVNESGLAGGSTAGTGHTVTDIVNLPSEVKAVPVTNGSTQYGTFSIDEDGHYTYTLTKPSNGDNVEDTFSYTTKDAQGNSTTNTVTITIIDDAPVAKPDTNSITEDSVPNPVSGNVLTGGVSSGDTADTQGADKANVSGVQAGTVASGEHVANGALNTAVNGEYGTLILRADGSYTYQLNNNNTDVNALKDNQSLQDVFSYTITDGDGDKSTATITITINGHTDGAPNVVITDHNGSALGANSIAENATTPVQGEFTVNAADGLKSITIGGTTILTSELLGLSPTTPQTIIGTQGTLTLTDYDPVTGKVSYSYQQSGSSKDHSGGDTSVSDTFPIVVTDNANESSAATNLVILITDTAPEAKADTGTVTEDGAALEGNVITGGSSNSTDVADRLGADATQVTGVSKGSSTTEQTGNVGGTGLAGDYGTLILNSDGSYSYTVDPNNATVNALKDGGKLTETFSYTIKDADGDWSTTTLTITINGHTDGVPSITPNDENGNNVGGQITVYESGLSTGSNASAASESASGTIQINAGDGLSSINIGGQTFSLSQLQSLSSSNPSAAINVAGGTIVLNGFTANSSVGGIPTSGSLSYTYTLNNAQTHSAVGNDDLLLSGIPLSVTDAGGVTTTGSLVVQVIDDVPTAVADTGSLSEGGVLSVLAADGVLKNDTAGADGWVNTGAVVGVVSGDTATNSAGGVGGRIDGQYGYITLNADGSYTYVSTADAVTADAQDVFTYTVRDADGDLTHSTLTINVANVNLTPAPISKTVNESGLAGGSTAGTGHTVTDIVNLPSEVKAVPVTNGSTQYGTFSIDEDGHYTYTLTKPSNGDNVEDTFSYTTKDAQGNSTTNTVTITIIDDAPVAKPDTNSITEDSVPNPVSGNVLTGGVSSGDTADTQGADKANVSGVQAGTVASGEHVANGALNTAVNGEYGTLILRADGSYTYQLNNNNTDVNALKDNQSLQDVFSYTITDGDGDKSTATITITINGHTDGAPNVVITDHNGSALGANSIAENATTPVQGEFTVNAADGLKSITIGGTTILTSELLGLSPTTPQTIIGTQGTLTLTDYDPVTGKVSYSYQQSGSSKDHSGGDTSVSDTFPIVVTDNANESSAATNLVILITDTAPEAKADTGTVTEDGAALEGNVITGGSSNSTDVADRLGADATQVTGVSKGSSTTEQTGNVGGTGLAGDYGTLILNSDGSYSYTVDPNNATVNALKDGGKLTETFSYTIKDADGDWSTTTLTITINGHTDGVPSITPNDENGNNVGGQITVYESGLSTGSNASAASESASGTIQINAGDGLSSINIGGQTFSLSQLQSLSSSNPSAAINVAGGTIVLNGFTANSSVGGIPTSGSLSYTYTLNNAQTHSAVGNDDLLLSGIPLSVTDAGGVTTTGSLVVQVIDDVPTAVADTGSLSEGGVLSVLAADGVLKNDTAGADGWVNTGAVVGVVSGDTATNSAGGVGGRIDGQYGYITLNADGSYTYVSTADAVTADAQDVFTYTVRDADGDLTHSTLTINVANVNLTPAPISKTVNESGLAGGSTAGTGHTVTDIVNLPSEVKAVPVTNGSTQYGTFSIDEDGHYTYTLTKPSNGDNVEDTFSYTTKDAQGNSTTNTVTITIIDDAPVAKPDTNSITEDSVPNPVSGNVLTGGVSSGDTADTQGADKANVSGVQAGTVASGEHVANGALNTAVNGEYGTLILRADGSYTYQLNNNNTDVNALKDNQSLQDVFSYTITDGDGDKSTATITITINGHTDGAPNVVITDHNGSALGANSIAENATTPVQGEFTVNAADGLKSITIGGTTILTSELLGLSPTTPQTIIGTQGTLTLTDYDPVTGKVSYSYQQSGSSKDHSGGDTSVSDTFPIVVTDNANESSAATNLVILITDTAPEAKADTGTVTEDGAALEGNVITGGSSNSTDVADRLGADATQVTGVSKGSSTTEQTGNVGGTGLAGDYGTLILNSDGSYSYTVDPNNATVNALKDGGKLTETFSYTIKDADGDWSTTTLTITINGHTDGVPSITPNDENGNNVGGQITVYESGLSTGSNASAASESASGTIQINAGDGLSSINIGGQTFSLSQLQSLSSSNPSAAINVAGGTIVLNGFTANSSVGGIPTSGSLSYTYTLNNAQTHSAVGNDGLLLSGIPLSVTDAGGVTTTGSLVVQVIDDVPTAVNDSNSIPVGSLAVVTGNVVSNDTKGADGARVTTVKADTANGLDVTIDPVGNYTVVGKYGTLTIHSDGSYSYARNAGSAGGVSDVFTYTLTDGDNDTSTAQLTINIADATPTSTIPTAGGATTTVYESGLNDGTEASTNKETTSGTISFTSPDGLAVSDAIKLGGHTLTTTNQTFSDGLTARYEYNAATGTGTIYYSYTLPAKTSGDNTTATFAVEIKDADGDSATAGNLVINIVDDAPITVADTGSVTEGALLTKDAASGVLSNDQSGADGWAIGGGVVGVAKGNTGTTSSTGVGTSITGDYGTLTLNANGSYSYKADPNKITANVQDVFTYTVRDADGDLKTSTLTINVQDVTVNPLTTVGSVREDGIDANGTQPAGTDASSSSNIINGDLNLQTGWTAQAKTGTTANGKYTVNSDGTYSFTLTSATKDLAGNETNSFTYTAVDQYGNTVTNTITISIVDDKPKISENGANVGRVTVDETNFVSGSVSATDANFVKDVFTPVYGADGQATSNALIYALNISSNGVDSGLDTTSGQNVLLYKVGNQIEGRAGSASGDVVFRISIDPTTGAVTLTQSEALKHPVGGSSYDESLSISNAGLITLTATATDGDGDAVTSDPVAVGDRFIFKDDGPSIGSAPAVTSVDEKGLATGSEPNTSLLTAEGNLSVSYGQDGSGNGGGLSFAANQTALKAVLDSTGNSGISFSINAAGNVLTATRGGSDVFKVTLDTTTGKYTFELLGSLNHPSHTTPLNLNFDFIAKDGDGDTASGSFVVQVIDDAPKTEIVITMDEDHSYGPFTTSADSRLENITIQDANGNTIAGTDNGNGSKSFSVAHGTVTVDEAGRITYKPADNYSNYDGSSSTSPDTFKVLVTDDSGQTTTTNVTVNVNPVADAPNLAGTTGVGGNVTLANVTTNEDTAVILGLKAPRVIDAIDQNGNTTTGDSPERLGVITLSGIPAGAALLSGTDATLFTSNGGNISIWLTDVNHPTDETKPANALEMTSAEFEALKVLPPAESHANFTVTVSVTSYEVNDSGTKVSGVNGATSTATVVVNVQAVTDGIDLKISDGNSFVDTSSAAPVVQTIAEDTALNLTNLLKVTLATTGDNNTTADIDGSEQRWMTITGLPEGTTLTVGGQPHTITATESSDGYRIDIPNNYNGVSPSLPSITVTPPKDFSGDINNIQITLHAQDQDSDGVGNGPTTGTEITDSVYLNLHVTPVAGDVAAGDVSTNEDTAVAFLQNVRVTDTGTGTEVITQVAFEIPTGWLVTAPSNNGGWSVSGDGSSGSPYTITFDNTLNEVQREAILDSFTILPPANSSKDATIQLNITSTDTNGSDTNTQTKPLDVKVTVNPVAEIIGNIPGSGDSDNDGTADLTMTGGHTYTTAGAEDTWYTLGTESGFNLANGWTNQDADELTYAHLTPELVSGDSYATVIGSQFKWTVSGVDYTATYTGTPIDVPVSALSTLQFLAPENVSGTFKIKVEAYTVDYDDDNEGTGTPATAVSGEAWLEGIIIAPVADGINTLSLNGRAIGLEDTPIPLSITPRSSDPSETFNITISDIPAGAKIIYGGVEQTITNGSVTISNFSTSTPLTITPPFNSNINFTLSVTATATDGSVISASSSPLSIPVTVYGVADTPTITLKDYDSNQSGVQSYTTTEANLDGTAQHKVSLSNLIENVSSIDNTDGSESFTLRITGLAKDFNLGGPATVLVTGTGEERVWVIKPTDLDHVFITVPENYSGNVNFKVAGVSTENDGDSKTGALTDVNFTVTPSAEAEATTSATLVEDEITTLNFGIVHVNGDNDETLGHVWIAQDQAAGAKYTLYLGTGTSAALLSNANLPIKTIDGVNYYELTAEQAQTLAAKGGDQLDGDQGLFTYKYEVTDNHYGSVQTAPADTVVKVGELKLTASAVTDAVELSVTGISGISNTTSSSDQHANDDATPDTATLTATDTVTVNLNVASIDHDGSEHVVRILIENVPEGVTVQGANVQQIGAGTWVLAYQANNAPSINAQGGIDVPVTFNIGSDAGGLTDHPIKITVKTQDLGSDLTAITDIKSDSVTWYLNTDFAKAPGSKAPLIDQWQYNDASATEDTPFKLSDVVDQAITIQDNSASNLFTVTLKDLPAGTIVNGMVQTMIDTNNDGNPDTPVWTASVTVDPNATDDEAEDALQNLLESIVITPPADWNDNGQSGQFHFVATLTTSVLGGATEEATIQDMTIQIAPVTDNPIFTMSGSVVYEGATAITSSITLDPADGSFGKVVDGKMYVQVNAADTTDAMEGGQLYITGSTTPLVLQSVDIDGDGTTDGDFYVIDIGENGGTVDLTYTMPNGEKTVPGNVSFTAYANVQEDGADVKAVSVTGSVEVQLINNGVNVVSQNFIGNESELATKANAIELTGAGGLSVSLNDSYGSESYGAILLSDVPNGFLVYVGNDAASATLASNAGGDGTTNTWVLSESGGLPAYVAILPPIHWSGTVENLQLVVTSGESSLSPLTETKDIGDLVVNAVANGVDIKPTQTFGKENEIIPLNLNASMHDPKVSEVANDSSTETMTIKLTGLGQYASFYIDGVQISSSQITVSGTGSSTTYTITGLTQSNIDKLGFKQAKAALTDQDSATTGTQIGVEAWTVESGAGNSASAHVSTNITVNMTAQQATTGNDTLLYTASSINAGAGIDTIQLRSGETVSGATLAANLKNVEVLDLSVNGANNITSLTASHVLTMTDAAHTLKINGTAEDTVGLGSGWTQSATNNGYVTYTSTVSGTAVTLLVSENVHTQSGVNPLSARSFSVAETSSDDVIVAKAGNDTITTGQGHDTLIYNVLDASDAKAGHGIDHWTDFGFGSTATDSNAETIQFSSEFFNDLLSDSDLTSSHLSQVEKFIKVDYDAATESATVKVDRDGEANGSNYQDLLVLEHQTSNVTLAELLNNHQITIG
ncbi:VCBS domain-containing protein [Acinetobacter baumannii]|nr:VCBS domain-containing protein [Acinetobacter baumannii]